MNNPHISILVPVYKVEAFLQRCIDSVLTQDFHGWEMILVDDGSPDRCPEICDKAAQKDSRISVVHKENGGLPSARLVGFERAKAEYLLFLDSDDWLLPNALHILYNAITSDGGYDIVKSLVLRQNDKGKKWIEHYPFESGIVENNNNIVNHLFCCEVSPYLHSGIYKKILFNNKFFKQVIDSGLSIGEDWVMNVLISTNAHKMKIIKEKTFVYYWNSTSFMTTTIRSPQYPQLVEKALGNYLNYSSPEIQQRFEAMKISNYIANCFRPEISFSIERYRVISKYIENAKQFEIIKKKMPRKYIWCIKMFSLFVVYTWFYRKLYYYFILNRHYRKVYPA